MKYLHLTYVLSNVTSDIILSQYLRGVNFVYNHTLICLADFYKHIILRVYNQNISMYIYFVFYQWTIYGFLCIVIYDTVDILWFLKWAIWTPAFCFGVHSIYMWRNHFVNKHCLFWNKIFFRLIQFEHGLSSNNVWHS